MGKGKTVAGWIVLIVVVVVVVARGGYAVITGMRGKGTAIQENAQDLERLQQQFAQDKEKMEELRSRLERMDKTVRDRIKRLEAENKRMREAIDKLILKWQNRTYEYNGEVGLSNRIAREVLTDLQKAIGGGKR